MSLGGFEGHVDPTETENDFLDDDYCPCDDDSLDDDYCPGDDYCPSDDDDDSVI